MACGVARVDGLNALVFAGDDRAGIGLAVAVQSAVMHLSAAADVVVVDVGMGEETRTRLARVHPAIRWVDVAPERLAGLPCSRLPAAAYAWLLVPELVPELQRAVYLDFDVLVKRDMAPLFAIDLNDSPVAAVRDLRMPYVKGSPQLNSGVVVLDCERWRASELPKHVFQYAMEHREEMVFEDQQALNVVIDRWVELDPSWNVQLRDVTEWPPSDPKRRLLPERERLWRDAAVVHFSAFPKPWLYWSNVPSTWVWIWTLLRSRYFTPAERARWFGVWLAKRVLLMHLRVRRRWQHALSLVQRHRDDQI